MLARVEDLPVLTPLAAAPKEWADQAPPLESRTSFVCGEPQPTPIRCRLRSYVADLQIYNDLIFHRLHIRAAPCSVQKRLLVSGLLRHDLAVLPHVERRAVRSRGLLSIPRGTAQGTSTGVKRRIGTPYSGDARRHVTVPFWTCPCARSLIAARRFATETEKVRGASWPFSKSQLLPRLRRTKTRKLRSGHCNLGASDAIIPMWPLRPKHGENTG